MRTGEYYYNVVWPETRVAVEGLFRIIRNDYLTFEISTYYDAVSFIYSLCVLKSKYLTESIIQNENDEKIASYLETIFARIDNDSKSKIAKNIAKLSGPRHNDFHSIIKTILDTGQLGRCLKYIFCFFKNEIHKYGSHVDIDGFADTFYSQMGENIPVFCKFWDFAKDEVGYYIYDYQEQNNLFCFNIDDNESNVEKKYIDAEYMWDFSERFARILTKDRRWGYLSDENGNVYMLDSDIIYAHTFHNGLALVETYNSMYYIDTRLKRAFDQEFVSASDFNHNIATVSNKICNEFRIDVNGNVIKEDIEKYNKAVEEYNKQLETNKVGSNPAHRSDIYDLDTYDAETEVMNALENGCGEYFGY